MADPIITHTSTLSHSVFTSLHVMSKLNLLKYRGRNKCKAVTCIRVTKTALVCQDVDYDHDRSDNLDDRNCEDIAMSFLVANMTCAPPIWVRGESLGLCQVSGGHW